MKTTIYIDKNLVPRYSPNGWPKELCPADAEEARKERIRYAYELEKAKADSIALEIPGGMLAIAPSLNPETFIDVEIGEVEICYQRDFSSTFKEIRWEEVSKEADDNNIGPYAQRKVARLKPAESDPGSINAAHGYSEGADISIDRDQRLFNFLSDNGFVSLEDDRAEIRRIITGSDMSGEEMNDCLRALKDPNQDLCEQLAAANKLNDELSIYLDATLKRVKELEQWKEESIYVWSPILDYCQDSENAKRLGIGLGQSISSRVLEILKKIK